MVLPFARYRSESSALLRVTPAN